MRIIISRVLGLKNFLNKISNENSVVDDINERKETSLGIKVLKYPNGKYFFGDSISSTRVGKEN